jgi:MoaA/NifB/PqqE/SkfB family radical SAM enzyme
MGSPKSQGPHYLTLLASLYRNAIKFRCSRLGHRSLKPVALSLALTNRCNSHCIMCNIWKRAGETPDIVSLELTQKEIIDLLSSPLLSELVELDLTGGEPHLRNDLVDIVRGVTELQDSYLSKLRSIIITSNGFLTERVISNYGEILKGLKDTNIDLVSVTSIDGIGETHDIIRGTGGAFELASRTIRGILELKKEYPNFIPGMKTTILPQNVDALDDLLSFALSNGLFHVISPVLFTEARFRNSEKRDRMMLAPDNIRKVLDFYRRDKLKSSYFYSVARDFLADGRRRWTCTAMYNYLFIDFDGKVYPCEIIPEPIGNVKEQRLQDIWNSPRARDWRKRIGKMECCRTCHEPGAVRYSAITAGTGYLRFLMRLGRQKYHESLEGEGFSKYLGD